MAFTARIPEDGEVFRGLFVVCALGGAWASWRIAHDGTLRLSHVIGLAILCRLLLFPMLPSLSDDGYRYIWDGMLLSRSGISPYEFVPSDPALSEFHGEVIFSRLNSPEYFSVYPPVSQAVFAVGGAVYGSGWMASWYAIKVVLLALEGFGIACLARVVGARGVALYALHPLALVEISGQGHTEGAMVAAIGLVLWAIPRHAWVAGLALAMAGWVKLYPLALGPLLGTRRQAWVCWALGGIAGALVLVPGDGGEHLLQSVALYGGTLDFYSAPFLLLKSVWFPVLGEMAGRWGALALGALWGACLIGIVLTRDGTPRSYRSGLALAVVAYALFSPMQHPWTWLGALFVLPLLRDKIPVWWIATVSLMTYARYVGLDVAYSVALVLGWGGGLGLATRALWLQRDL